MSTVNKARPIFLKNFQPNSLRDKISPRHVDCRKYCQLSSRVHFVWPDSTQPISGPRSDLDYLGHYKKTLIDWLIDWLADPTQPTTSKKIGRNQTQYN